MVCVECGHVPPQHQYFCEAVAAYARGDVLLEMAKLAAQHRRIERLERSLRKAGEDEAADDVAQKLFLVRDRFWGWSWWLDRKDAWTRTRDEREAIKAEVRALHRRRRSSDLDFDIARESAA